MRDSNAPIINGYDCSGLVNRYSFRCEQSYPDRGDTARTLDGASQTDVFPRKIRLSWTLNSVSSQQFADFNAALDTSDTINLVSAVAYDPTRDALCSGNFHITRPAFPFALAVNGSPISQAGAELILDQQGALDWISVTPPSKLAYDIGDTFDSAGFRVTLTDDKDSVADITSECSLSIADGDLLPDAGNFPVSVARNGIPVGAFTLSVSDMVGGAWWSLNLRTGALDVFCNGEMPTMNRYYGDKGWIDYHRKIVTVNIRACVTSISRSAFANCENLISVTIPDSVTLISLDAFYDCRALTSVTIPDSVTSIYDGAFWRCDGLTSVTIPDSVILIGNRAFQYCKLTALKLSENLKVIEESAFAYNSIKSVIIPDGATEIESYAFFHCDYLSSVTIPASVTWIGHNAFTYATFRSVTISRNCGIGQDAFPSGCVISYYEDEEAGT